MYWEMQTAENLLWLESTQPTRCTTTIPRFLKNDKGVRRKKSASRQNTLLRI